MNNNNPRLNPAQEEVMEDLHLDLRLSKHADDLINQSNEISDLERKARLDRNKKLLLQETVTRD